MQLEELKQAVANGDTLIWSDPEPIEGNDYRISYIDVPDIELGVEEQEDLIILIQYNDGMSEAEVFLHEITN